MFCSKFDNNFALSLCSIADYNTDQNGTDKPATQDENEAWRW